MSEVYCGTAEQCANCRIGYLPKAVLDELRPIANAALEPDAIQPLTAKQKKERDDSSFNTRIAIEKTIEAASAYTDLSDAADLYGVHDPSALAATAVLTAIKGKCINIE